MLHVDLKVIMYYVSLVICIFPLARAKMAVYSVPILLAKLSNC